MRTLGALFVATALATSACVHGGDGALDAPEILRVTQQRPGFDQLDANRDDRVDEHELLLEALRYYDVWDRDEDGRLTRPELDVALFESWDRDDDHRVSRAEFLDGADVWLTASESSFSDWDDDHDGALDRAELRDGVADERVFERFDANGDGSVTDLEMSDAMFAYWDANGDGGIDALEWRGDEGESISALLEPSATARERARASAARLR